jgi:ferrous iron transport protein A
MKNVPLSYVKTGQLARIQYIDRECQSCKRLLELGLIKGLEIKVVKNNSGPVIVQMNNNKLAIGRCLTNRIIVNLI